ncbi:MAG TPA: hypothetical protein PLZ43_11295 [bacterium]|nr:hypothetical protein [bacterium]
MDNKKVYHVQCTCCCCTLYAPRLEEDEEYEYITTGEICNTCQKEKDAVEQEEMEQEFEGVSLYHRIGW